MRMKYFYEIFNKMSQKWGEGRRAVAPPLYAYDYVEGYLRANDLFGSSPYFPII